MKYLLFYIDGFIKKFPLDKPEITIGRTAENDLILKEKFVSRQHTKIMVEEDSVIVTDLDSTNGTYVKGSKVKTAVLEIGDSFNLGKVEFLLKRGSLDEFKLEKDLIPIFDEIAQDKKKDLEESETRYIKDVFTELLKEFMHTGLKKEYFSDLMLDLSNLLPVLTDFGSFFIVSKQNGELNILLSVESEAGMLKILKQIVNENGDLFKEDVLYKTIPGSSAYFYSYPFKIGSYDTSLIFITGRNQKKKKDKVESFLSSLAKEVALLSQILLVEKPAAKKDKENDGSQIITDDIVIASPVMKELVKQAQKIGQSDIFVLVQGESGTGKEVFAKIIHNHSKRRTREVVAINCAAIPENLLESELFGHEKGAFTDAYAQKKGKLEIASGSTLILDEIGDMPLNLQAKLLRALQEKEFYRLGGTVPIKVDLRIISLTNQDIKKLIKEGKFREDLYFRLVHRIIVLPPLRERKEDISALINHFTKKFCVLSGKKIKGYTVKAYEVLKDCEWKGNVRQLENEINSIVNLTEDGEIINYDILSDEIKAGAREATQTLKISPLEKNEENDKDFILELLEKNNWNKSKTARELGMTYRGLHKKMKRLGIGPPEV